MNKEKQHKGFAVPKDYFEGFEDRLAIRLMEEQLPDATGFKVPQDYFAGLEERLLERSRLQETRLPRFVPRNLIWYAAAAILIAVVLTVPFGGSHSTPSLSDISPEIIQTYIDNGGIDIHASDILGMLDEASIEELEATTETLSDAALEDYLLQEMEYTQLITE